MSTKENVLILEDDPHKASKLQDALINVGYDVELAMTEKEARIALKSKKIDILCFDIGIDVRNEGKTSIPFAMEANEVKPLPTLFYTQYGKNTDYFKATREIRHSIWQSRGMEDWEDSVINGLTIAKERFRDCFPELGSKRIILDKITFKDKDSKNRFILEKNDILYIQYDKDKDNKARSKIYIDSHNKYANEDEYSDINHPHFSIGTGIANILRQLTPYKEYGWKFKKVDGSTIVNLEKVVRYNDGYLYLYSEHQKKIKKILTSKNSINDSNFSDIFVNLITEHVDKKE